MSDLLVQTAKNAVILLKRYASSERRESSMRFFKTGPGQYGEGDVFMGVSTPDIRKVATQFKALSFKELTLLLSSRIHEERLLALHILVMQFRQSLKSKQEKYLLTCVQFFLKNLKYVNNWDLVDSSASQILGAYLQSQAKGIDQLIELAHSSRMWDRRVAMVATYYFTQQGELKPCLQIAKILLKDPEDLMHKACGWMLREVGKQDLDTLRQFLNKNVSKMPRTMLRYAIEKMDDQERQHYRAL